MQNFQIIPAPPKLTIALVILLSLAAAGILLTQTVTITAGLMGVLLLSLFFAELWLTMQQTRLLNFSADLQLSFLNKQGQWQKFSLEKDSRVFGYFVILIGKTAEGKRYRWLFEKTQMPQETWRHLNVFINAYRLEKQSGKKLICVADNDQGSK